MKHLIKTTLLLALVLLAMVSCSGNQSVSNSDSTFEVNGIYYNKINSNEVEVTYKGTSCSQYSNDYSGSVTIPATVTYNGTTYSVTSIGYGAFDPCSSLTNINIPNSVTNICSYAFRGCSSLTAINIPNSVTSIQWDAFSGCSSLTTINIPNSVTTIGEDAFSDCPSLNDIYCYATTPPRCENSCFINYSATLHVPAASLAAYRAAPVWNKFKNIVGDADATNGHRNQSR